MQSTAMQLKMGDMLTDGSIVTSITRSEGLTFARLHDGRRLVCPDSYLLDVRRAPSAKGPGSEPEALDFDGWVRPRGRPLEVVKRSA